MLLEKVRPTLGLFLIGLISFAAVGCNSPDDVPAQKSLVSPTLTIAQNEKAIENYTEAIRLNPDDAKAYNNRGASYRKLGQNQKAIENYTEAIRLNPDDAKAYNNRGVAYHFSGQYEKAIEDYIEAIRLDPGNEFALDNKKSALAKISSDDFVLPFYILLGLLVLIGIFIPIYITRPNKDQTIEVEDGSDSLQSSINLQLDKGLIKEIDSLSYRIHQLENSLEKTDSLRKKNEALQNTVKNYINGYSFSVLKLGISDLIEAYEYTTELASVLEEEQLNEPKLDSYIKAALSHLNQGLEIAGIEQFSPDIGIHYTKSFGAKMIDSRQTQDLTKEGTIAEIISPGWKTKLPDDSSEQEILRKATVAVYTQKPQ